MVGVTDISSPGSIRISAITGDPVARVAADATVADVAMAIARGADCCGIGRPYLYGAAVGGRRGVEAVIDILVSQLKSTMQLLGSPSIAELREHGDELVVPVESTARG